MHHKQLQAALYNQLRKGERMIEELSGEEVESLVLYILEKDNPSSKIENYTGHGGPIDIVMRRLLPSPDCLFEKENTQTLESTYIECKHYRRKLELDTIAKVFIVTVIDKPNALVIVSSSDLAPQAERCAKYLFHSLDKVKLQHNPLQPPGTVTNTLFRVLRLEELLGIDITQKSQVKGHRPKPTWEIVEETPFGDKFISSGLAKVILSPSGNYRVSLQMYAPANNTVCNSLHIGTIDTNYKRVIIHRDTVQYIDNGLGTFEFTFKASELQPTSGNKWGKIFVVVNWGNSKEKWKREATLLQYRLVRLIPELPDFRGLWTQNLVEDFVFNPEKHILSIHGSGGTGKTWTSNSTARQLQLTDGAICQALMVDDVTSIDILKIIAWNLMMPALPMPAGDIDLVTFSEQWLKASSGFELTNSHKLAFNELFDGTKYTDSMDGITDRERLALALSLLLVHSPTPQVIIFRDCHLASASFTNVLNHLIRNMANLGWGRTRVIFEYRDGLEKRKSWENFIKKDFGRFSNVTIDVHLTGIKVEDLENSLSSVTVGGHCGPLAKTIFEKTFGNALLVHHLLLYFSEKGYIAIADNLGHKMHIVSFADIMHELTYDIGLPDEVLPTRIKYFIERLSKLTKKSFVQYLIAAAFSGLQYDESLFSSLFTNNVKTLDSIRQQLLDSEIIVLTDNQHITSFVHDFMRIAVQSVLTNNFDFKKNGETVLKYLPSDTISAHIVAGSLLNCLGRPREAFQRFDNGQELSKLQGTLLLRERCLAGARDALENIQVENKVLIQQRTAIGIALSDTLTQTGSQIRALDSLMRVWRMLDSQRAKFLVSSQTRNVLAANILRLQFTLLVRLLKAKEFFQTFNEISIYNLSEVDIHYALTRFSLMAIHCGKAQVAWEALTYAKSTCSGNSDEKSSLYSDVGRLYLQANPQTALKYWKKGFALAKKRKQISHSQLNILVANLYLACDNFSSEDFDNLETELIEQGVANQLCRLWTCKGIFLVNQGKISRAMTYFEQALIKSQEADQPYWQWKSHNNVALCFAYEEDHKEAESHFLAAFSLISSLAYEYNQDNSLLLTPLRRLVNEHDLQSCLSMLKKHSPPVFCGLYHIVFRNMEALRISYNTQGEQVIRQDTAWKLPTKSSSYLWLEIQGAMCAFAIE